MPDHGNPAPPMAQRLEAQRLDASRAIAMTGVVRGVMFVLLIPVGILAAVLAEQASPIHVLGIAGAVFYAINVVLVASFCGAVRRGASDTIGMVASMTGQAPDPLRSR